MMCSFIPLQAGAAATPTVSPAASSKLIITELQTSGKSSSEEFVEFYNTTDMDIDLADTAHSGKEPWKLQFFSASATTNGTPDWARPTATTSLAGTVPAHGYFVLGSTGYAPGGIDSDQAYSSRLADSGGGLQLITVNTTTTTYYDRLMWKQAPTGQVLLSNVLAAPAPGGSLQRLTNENGEYIDQNNKLTAFAFASEISPKDMWHEPTPPAPISKSEDTPTPTPETGSEPSTPALPVDTSNAGLQAPQITELLPNPAPPLTDTADEFIELYNPNAEPFSLKGYTLEVGTSTLHDFTFGDGILLAPSSYLAFFSRDTKLSLANSGGRTRLINPAGVVIDETAAYEVADGNISWAWDGSSWQWSTTPTPNALNTITAVVAPVKASTIKTTTAQSTAKKATPQVAAAKPSAKVQGTNTTKTTAKPKATAKKKTTKAKPLSTATAKTGAPEKAPIHTGVLVAVVACAVLYAGYEYRHDLRNQLHKLRYHRAVRAYGRQ